MEVERRAVVFIAPSNLTKERGSCAIDERVVAERKQPSSPAAHPFVLLKGNTRQEKAFGEHSSYEHSTTYQLVEIIKREMHLSPDTPVYRNDDDGVVARYSCGYVLREPPFNIPLWIAGWERKEDTYPRLEKLIIRVGALEFHWKVLPVVVAMRSQKAHSVQESITLAKQEAKAVWKKYGKHIRDAFAQFKYTLDKAAYAYEYVRSYLEKELFPTLRSRLFWIMVHPNSVLDKLAGKERPKAGAERHHDEIVCYTEEFFTYELFPYFAHNQKHLIEVKLDMEVNLPLKEDIRQRLWLAVDVSVKSGSRGLGRDSHKVDIPFDAPDEKLGDVAQQAVERAAELAHSILKEAYKEYYDAYSEGSKIWNSTTELPPTEHVAEYMCSAFLYYTIKTLLNAAKATLPYNFNSTIPDIAVDFSNAPVYKSVARGEWRFYVSIKSVTLQVPEVSIILIDKRDEGEVVLTKVNLVVPPFDYKFEVFEGERRITCASEAHQVAQEILNLLHHKLASSGIVHYFCDFLSTMIRGEKGIGEREQQVFA